VPAGNDDIEKSGVTGACIVLEEVTKMTKTAVTTLEKVGVKRKSLEDYRVIVGDDVIDQINLLAGNLRGVRLLHINATGSGGGVAELLNSLVPLEQDCGLEAEWRILCKHEPLFKATKNFHNALQGMPLHRTQGFERVYLERNRHCAAMLGNGYDVVLIHDPQPAALPHFVNFSGTKWIWRCHIDTSQPDPEIWGFLRQFIQEYDVAVFTIPEFVPSDFNGSRMEFIPPAIDPLSPKNRAIPKYVCREVVYEFGIDLSRPLIIQVARFDPWKDPGGVIEAYRLVKQDLPEIQLVLIGAMAEDDPEAWEIYNSIRRNQEGDPDLHIFSNLTGVGAHEVNCFQRVADVVIQKSIREGFGLVVSEALWKGTPVVAGNTGGIPLQMQNGIGGFLVNTVEECAEKVAHLLTRPYEAESIARCGWHRVRDHFLMPRLLLDELRLVESLINQEPKRALSCLGVRGSHLHNNNSDLPHGKAQIHEKGAHGDTSRIQSLRCPLE
jgi:trehalose synthase